MTEQLINLFFYSAWGFFGSTILFFSLAGMMEPGERTKRNVQRVQDAAGLNMGLMVLSVLCWGVMQIFEIWWAG